MSHSSKPHFKSSKEFLDEGQRSAKFGNTGSNGTHVSKTGLLGLGKPPTTKNSSNLSIPKVGAKPVSGRKLSMDPKSSKVPSSQGNLYNI